MLPREFPGRGMARGEQAPNQRHRPIDARIVSAHNDGNPHFAGEAVAVTGAVALAAGTLIAGGAAPAGAATSLPCDIYATAGTPCVAAHSTTRALYAAYNGPLYQVRRASNGATTNIGTLAAGGYANAAAQDSFCAGTTCTITEIFDQSPQHNNLTIGPARGAGGAHARPNATPPPLA